MRNTPSTQAAHPEIKSQCLSQVCHYWLVTHQVRNPILWPPVAAPWPPLSFCHPQGSTAVKPSPGNIASEQGESEREHFSSDQGLFLLSPLLRNGTGVTGSTCWHPLHATVATVQKLQMLLFVVTKGVVPCRGVQSRLRGEAMTHGRRKESVDDGLATGQGDAMAHGKRISMSSSSSWQDRERPGRFCVPALHGELTHLPVTSPNLLLLQAQGS